MTRLHGCPKCLPRQSNDRCNRKELSNLLRGCFVFRAQATFAWAKINRKVPQDTLAVYGPYVTFDVL
jgi:hypothetical protein